MRVPLHAVVLVAFAVAGCAASPGQPTVREVVIYSAGQGSAFLPYAQGLAKHLSLALGVEARAIESAGSIENLRKVNAAAAPTGTAELGLAFLGTAYEAWTGTGAWTKGEKLANVRSLFPMYETSFQVVALAPGNIRSLADLRGKRVGVGPRGGPAESFFRGLLEAVGSSAEIVNGTPSELGQALIQGRIDALWQGAVVPIPAIQAVADQVPAVVFGLNDAELAAMLARFPFLARAEVAAGTYRGQTAALRSVAAWNFVVAPRNLADADAYAVTRAALSARDPAAAIHPSAAPTRAENARTNGFLPFHPGALRYYREVGITGLPAAT